MEEVSCEDFLDILDRVGSKASEENRDTFSLWQKQTIK